MSKLTDRRLITISLGLQYERMISEIEVYLRHPCQGPIILFFSIPLAVLYAWDTNSYSTLTR